MIALLAVTAVLLLLMAFSSYAIHDLFRQTAAWSARHGNPAYGPTQRPRLRIRTAAGAAEKWTALDDLQLTRALRDQFPQR
jgi:hypothetical protein